MCFCVHIYIYILFCHYCLLLFSIKYISITRSDGCLFCKHLYQPHRATHATHDLYVIILLLVLLLLLLLLLCLLHMYIFMYICIYYTCMHIYIYIYVCMCIYIYIYIYIYITLHMQSLPFNT